MYVTESREDRSFRFSFRVLFLYAKSRGLKYQGHGRLKPPIVILQKKPIYLFTVRIFFIVLLPCPSHLGFGRSFALLLAKPSDLLHESEELFVALPEKHPFVVTKNDGYLGVARQIFAATQLATPLGTKF